MTPEERFAAAEARYKAKFVTIMCDTPELAAEHGVRLGDAVDMFRSSPRKIVWMTLCTKLG